MVLPLSNASSLTQLSMSLILNHLHFIVIRHPRCIFLAVGEYTDSIICEFIFNAPYAASYTRQPLYVEPALGQLRENGNTTVDSDGQHFSRFSVPNLRIHSSGILGNIGECLDDGSEGPTTLNAGSAANIIPSHTNLDANETEETGYLSERDDREPFARYGVGDT